MVVGELMAEFLWERRPQELCKMCGKCCRVVTTPKPYEEIKKLADAGDVGALDFLELFEPYECIEDAIIAGKDIVENIGYDKNTTFYHCRYLQKNNLCSRYDTRKDLCRHCPATPFSVVPPGCGFADWLQAERLKIVEKVRGWKKEREVYNLAILRGCTPEKKATLEKLIAVLDYNIESYAKYGSHEW